MNYVKNGSHEFFAFKLLAWHQRGIFTTEMTKNYITFWSILLLIKCNYAAIALHYFYKFKYVFLEKHICYLRSPSAFN